MCLALINILYGIALDKYITNQKYSEIYCKYLFKYSFTTIKEKKLWKRFQNYCSNL